MGTYTNLHLQDMLDPQSALAGLAKRTLERDDSYTVYPHRIYRDKEGKIYHSVTHIIKETADPLQKQALERWLERKNSEQERDIAAQRGTLTHNHAEYILKTAAKLSRNSANRRDVWKTSDDGLERCPSPITKWAIEKATKSAPRLSWSAGGYTRSLRSWIAERVTAIHAVEFSVYSGCFAGTADALLDIDDKGPFIVDWKTSQHTRSEELLADYCDQIGAYSLGLRELTGIERLKGAFIVVARRSGAPQVRELSELELRGAESRFIERSKKFLRSYPKESAKVYGWSVLDNEAIFN